MTEPKYIDAARLIRRLENRTYRAKGKFIEMVNEQPAADVVEVVRCKDCKHAHMTMDGYCKYCDIWFPDEKEYMPGDYYCASGEKKDGYKGGKQE